MTEQPADGAAPVRTRAERRRQQSWFGRRRARKNARRRTKRVNARSPESVEESVEESSPEPTVEQSVDVIETTILDIRETPMVEVTPDPSVEDPSPEPTVEDGTGVLELPAAADTAPAEPDDEDVRTDRASRRARRTPKSRTPKSRTPKSRTPKSRPAKSRPATAPAPRVRTKAAMRTPFWTRTMPAIAGALGILVALGVIVRAADDGTELRRSAARNGGATTAGTLLLVHHSELSGNDLIVLLGRDRASGSALLIPAATQLDVPALGVATLGAIPVDDNGARLANSVENVIGIGIGRTVVLDDAGLTAVLGPAAPIRVTLTAPVEILVPPVSFPAGDQELSSAQANELLSGPQSVNELDRLVTAGTVLEAWLTRLKDPTLARQTANLQGDLEPLIAVASAPDHRIDTLPVDSIAITGGERFAVRESDLIAYVQRAFPHDRLGTGQGRPRVEVLNGTGFLGVAQAVADKVVPAGGKITLTENVRGFGQDLTEIVYFQDEWRESAQRLLDAMGCGSLRKARKDLGISDVTIVVGADCPQYGAPGGSN